MSDPGPWYRDAHQDALMAAAARLGIEVSDLAPAWGEDAVRYRRGGRAVTVVAGRLYPGLGALAAYLCDHKHACKAELAALGLPVPRGVIFTDPTWGTDATRVAALLAGGGRFACKPDVGSQGRGVGLGLTTVDEVAAHWRAAAVDGERFVLEAEIVGADLRLQAVGGRLVAACVREPASVVGDGLRPLAALIEARAAEVARPNPANRLVVDDVTEGLLLAQGLALADVPAAGRVVHLKPTANMATGGRARDVTDALHPGYGAWIERIAAAFDLGVFAVDCIAPDPATLAGASILEVNARPEWLHHTFSEGRRHDLPRLILDALLPP